MQLRSAQVAQNINRRLERLLPLLFPFGVALGFALPGVFMHVRPFVPMLFGLITLSGALGLTFREFGVTVRSPLPIILFMAVNRLLMPLIAMLAANVFFASNREIVTGFVLLFSGPMAVASFIWVGIFKGDKALCLTLLLLDTLLAPLVVPGTLSILMGETVEMNMGGIALSLVYMVVIPTIVGIVVNETSGGRIPVRVSPYLSPASKMMFLFVIAANTSVVAPAVSFGDSLVWKVAALSLLLSLTGFMAARLLGIAAKCTPEKKIALFFSGGLKNVSAIATIAVAFFPETVALPVIVTIALQQVLAAVMSKFGLRRL